MPQIEIVSPLPGTFYGRSAPDAPPYVSVGARVKAGDVVGLVEVMKQFSEINAETDGVVVRIAAASGDPVEPGQVLFVIETN